jgi:hypothetical protein
MKNRKPYIGRNGKKVPGMYTERTYKKYPHGGTTHSGEVYDEFGNPVDVPPPVTPASTVKAITPQPQPNQAEQVLALTQEYTKMGMRPGKAHRMAMKDLGLKKTIDPNAIINTVGNIAGAVENISNTANRVGDTWKNQRGKGGPTYKPGGRVTLLNGIANAKKKKK